ncbi:MAG: glutathione S-transferase domain-containing protein [Myxococcales bacterium]|nr:glutathione S-transferase domain-containing protein [Myxococcales bacterium]
MLELVAISYSPWSEKARWALDHHSVLYGEVEHLPMLGEPALRKRLGKWRGKISIPLLLKTDGAVHDSFEIAEYAEEIGSSPVTLFPDEKREMIVGWSEQSETALAAGRALVSTSVLQDVKGRPN